MFLKIWSRILYDRIKIRLTYVESDLQPGFSHQNRDFEKFRLRTINDHCGKSIRDLWRNFTGKLSKSINCEKREMKSIDTDLDTIASWSKTDIHKNLRGPQSNPRGIWLIILWMFSRRKQRKIVKMMGKSTHNLINTWHFDWMFIRTVSLKTLNNFLAITSVQRSLLNWMNWLINHLEFISSPPRV